MLRESCAVCVVWEDRRNLIRTRHDKEAVEIITLEYLLDQRLNRHALLTRITLFL
jgi:hypothetical protein